MTPDKPKWVLFAAVYDGFWLELSPWQKWFLQGKKTKKTHNKRQRLTKLWYWEGVI